MGSVRACLRRLSLTLASAAPKRSLLAASSTVTNFTQLSDVHTTAPVNKMKIRGKHFLDYNKTFFPVQGPNEERRPAYVCNVMTNIKYSPKNMWYIACLVRGMTVDEAVKQLSFLSKKGAVAVKDTILEAQQMAVERHNVEYKSNLWVAESFCTKGVVVKGLRRHGKARQGTVRYKYCHYFVRLEEGTPPEHYYLPIPKSGEELLEDWKESMHRRKIIAT